MKIQIQKIHGGKAKERSGLCSGGNKYKYKLVKYKYTAKIDKSQYKGQKWYVL